MATIKLKRGLESKVSSLPKEDGSLIFGYNTASVPATMQLDQSINGTVQRLNLSVANSGTSSYAKNSGALGGSSLQNIIDKINTTSGSGNAFTGLDTATNNVVKLTRANGGTVQKTIDNVAHATSAAIASSAVKLQTARKINDASFNGTADIDITELRPINIANQTLDLNTLTLNSTTDYIGKKLYFCGTDGGSANISNKPYSENAGFILEVEQIRNYLSSSDYQTKQTLEQRTTGKVWIRYCTNGTWSGWILQSVKGVANNSNALGGSSLSQILNSVSSKVGASTYLNNCFTSRPADANIGITGKGGIRTFKATSSMTSHKPSGDGHILHFDWDNTGGYDSQLFLLNGSSPHVQIRGMSGGTWDSWINVLDQNNYTSYAAKKNSYNSASISNASIKLGRSDGSTGTTLTVNNVSHATSADISSSSNKLISRGNIAAIGTTQTLDWSGLWMSGVYNNGYPISYGNLINLHGGGYGQILIGWNGTNPGNFIRAKRDVASEPWTPWARIITSLDALNSSSSAISSTNNYFTAGATTAYVASKLSSSSGDKTAFTGLDTTTNNVVKLTRANGGTVQKTIDNVSHATSATIASSANRINPTLSLTGGDGNTAGYRLVATISISAWGNYRGIFTVKSRHTGGGILTISVGCNTSPVSQENAYFEIKYWGPTSFGSIISSDSWQGYISSDGTKGYLFWKYNDYNTCYVTQLSSDFTLSNGTWMTSISSSYGIRKSSTSINYASDSAALGGSSLQNIIDKINSTSGSGNAFTSIDTATNNIIKLARANGGTVQKTIDNVSHATSATISSTANLSKNSNALGGSSLSQILASINSGSVSADSATRIVSSSKSIVNNFTIRTGTPTSSGWTQYPIYPISTTTDPDLTAYKGKSLSILHMDGGAQRHDIVALNGANDGLIYATATSAGTTSSRIERILDGGNYGSLITNLNKQVTFSNGLKAQSNVQMDGGNFSTGSTVTTGNGETSFSDVKIYVNGNTLVISTK